MGKMQLYIHTFEPIGGNHCLDGISHSPVRRIRWFPYLPEFFLPV